MYEPPFHMWGNGQSHLCWGAPSTSSAMPRSIAESGEGGRFCLHFHGVKRHLYGHFFLEPHHSIYKDHGGPSWSAFFSVWMTMSSNAFLRARLLLIMESNSVNVFDPNKIVRHAPFSGFLRKKPCEYRWRRWLVHKSHTFFVCLFAKPDSPSFSWWNFQLLNFACHGWNLHLIHHAFFFPRCRICVLHWCVRHGQRWQLPCIIWSSGNECLSPMNEFMDAYGPWLVTALPSFSCIPPLNHIFLAGCSCLDWWGMCDTATHGFHFPSRPRVFSRSSPTSVSEFLFRCLRRICEMKWIP